MQPVPTHPTIRRPNRRFSIIRWLLLKQGGSTATSKIGNSDLALNMKEIDEELLLSPLKLH
jgi:hypothetical protein